MSEMFFRAADFPDAVIGLSPDSLQIFQERDLKIEVGVPVIFFDAAGMVQNVSKFSKDVELQLVDGRIAHAYRRGPAIAFQPWHFPLHEMAFAGNAIDHLELIRTSGYTAY